MVVKPWPNRSLQNSIYFGSIASWVFREGVVHLESDEGKSSNDHYTAKYSQKSKEVLNRKYVM